MYERTAAPGMYGKQLKEKDIAIGTKIFWDEFDDLCEITEVMGDGKFKAKVLVEFKS